MEKAYEKLLAEHKIAVNELPADAQTGIKKIKAIEAAINLQDKKAAKVGKTYSPSSSVLSDIRTFDKWIVREILDYVEDKETNTDAPSVDANEIVAEIKADADPSAEVAKVEEPVKSDPKGMAIDAEFIELIKNNKQELTLEDLKVFSPEAYSVVFSSYEKGGANGIETTYHTLIEQNEKFILTKK